MRHRFLVISLLCLHAGLLAWSARCHSPTWNEPAHLAAGISHLVVGRFDLYRVNPPLVRTVAAVPVVLAGYEPNWRGFHEQGRPVFRIGRDLMAANGERSAWLITIARWACIPFSLVGALFCSWWARDLYGQRAGSLALVLWCLSPNILANASLITPDAGATALGGAACFALWKWLKQPTWMKAFIAGIALGIAELTKMTLLAFYPVWIVVWFASRVGLPSPGSDAVDGDTAPSRWRTELSMVGLAFAVSLYVLNLGYGFEASCQSLGDFEFVSELLGGDDVAQGKQGNRFRHTILGRLPVPLPANYLRGFDVQRRDFEYFGRQSYLHGQFSNKGWWYYYLYGITVKVPLGLWALLIFAVGVRMTRCVRAFRGKCEADAKVNWRDELAVLVPLFAILALVSSQSGFSHHFRYILPIFPFAFIWISQVAEYTSRASRVVVSLAVLWFVGSSLSVYPHSLSYFNELAGGPRGGHAHMIHSSIDWGQDLLFLKQWVDDHPEAKPLHLIYCGDFDPTLLGLQFEAPQFAMPDDGFPTSLVLEPGWYAVSVNFLRGYSWRAPVGGGRFVTVPQDACSSLLRKEPTAMAGYSIYIYEVPPMLVSTVADEE
ncbi:MAG: glycosyltransferase family 39 protein [Planctomycetales bacterium]|nr:glycosyltransferase family 39 protein [Planctomycetales bacterium]